MTLSGPSLLSYLDNIEVTREAKGALIIPINEKFKDMGTVIGGKIEHGRVKRGQTILIMPNRVFSFPYFRNSPKL